MSEPVFDWEDSDGVAASIDYEGDLWVNGERVRVESSALARRIAAQFKLVAMHLEPLESAAAKPRGRRDA